MSILVSVCLLKQSSLNLIYNLCDKIDSIASYQVSAKEDRFGEQFVISDNVSILLESLEVEVTTVLV